ncbi:MAG: FecR family protein [Kiritimatiellae bacterium]|nr:FecR family protein [Kiritimatiellia bacterium]MDD5522619.1 FecR family protein [Kiritimatiellia bacterium]
MADDSFIHLVDGYLDGKLDKDDLKRFLAMIEESPENREILAQNAIISRLILTAKRNPVSIEQILMALPRHGDTAKLIIDQIRSNEEMIVQNGKAKAAQIRKNGMNGQKKPTSKFRKPSLKIESETSGIVFFFRTVTALAACALIAFGIWKYVHQLSVSPGPIIATLDGRGDILIRRGNMPVPGKINTPIYNGDSILVGLQAMAVVRYNNENTVLKIQEGTLLKVENKNDAKGVFLKQGTIVASVAPQPKDLPMTLTTPKACATVIGTRFSLQSSEVTTFLDVTSGKVRVTRNADNLSAEVSTGNRIEVTDNVPLTIQPAQTMVLGHLGGKQVEEMFQTMTTARAFGINTLTLNVTSMDHTTLPESLRQAIATAHRANIKFYAKLDIPKDLAGNYDNFMIPLKNKLSQIVLDYNFDGVYVARPHQMMANGDLFKRVMNDICLAVNNTGVPVETGIQREISTNDTWFIGY